MKEISSFLSHVANCKMLPIHVSPEKTFCRGQKFWQPTGHSSLVTVIQGNTDQSLVFLFLLLLAGLTD